MNTKSIDKCSSYIPFVLQKYSILEQDINPLTKNPVTKNGVCVDGPKKYPEGKYPHKKCNSVKRMAFSPPLWWKYLKVI